MAFRNEAWKTEGVSTFSIGVLVRGHGIHIIYVYHVKLYVIEGGDMPGGVAQELILSAPTSD